MPPSGSMHFFTVEVATFGRLVTYCVLVASRPKALAVVTGVCAVASDWAECSITTFAKRHRDTG